jgi:hypothetical protein
VSLWGRLRAALRPEPVPTPTPPVREGQEVWGPDRTRSSVWRLIGRDESPLEGLVASGLSDIGPGTSGGGAVGDLLAALPYRDLEVI